MTALPLGLIIEALVALLLVCTIAYCAVINKRLKRLQSDEQVLRATIAELVTATEIAERAIFGLKSTAQDCDRTLALRLREAEQYNHQIAGHLEAGDMILRRLAQVAELARSHGVPATSTSPVVSPEAKRVAQTQGFAKAAPQRPAYRTPATGEAA